jgi:hypothetical protein
MMSLQAIADLSRAVAVKAAAQELEPYQPASVNEPAKWGRSFPIPNLGDYRPSGWKLVDNALVDATGTGAEWEGAVTVASFPAWCSRQMVEHPGAGFGMIEEGQFQVVVGVFIPGDEDEPQAEYDWDTCWNCGDPYEIGEEYCPWCDTEINPDDDDEEPPFKEGDTVEILGFTGTVVNVDSEDETVEVEYTSNERYAIEWFSWDEVKKPYNPADDPNQISLDWMLLGE